MSHWGPKQHCMDKKTPLNIFFCETQEGEKMMTEFNLWMNYSFKASCEGCVGVHKTKKGWGTTVRSACILLTSREDRRCAYVDRLGEISRLGGSRWLQMWRPGVFTGCKQHSHWTAPESETFLSPSWTDRANADMKAAHRRSQRGGCHCLEEQRRWRMSRWRQISGPQRKMKAAYPVSVVFCFSTPGVLDNIETSDNVNTPSFVDCFKSTQVDI